MRRPRQLKPIPRPILIEPNLIIEAKRHLDTAFRMFDDAPNKVNHDRLVEAQRIYLFERESNRVNVQRARTLVVL